MQTVGRLAAGQARQTVLDVPGARCRDTLHRRIGTDIAQSGHAGAVPGFHEGIRRDMGRTGNREQVAGEEVDGAAISGIGQSDADLAALAPQAHIVAGRVLLNRHEAGSAQLRLGAEQDEAPAEALAPAQGFQIAIAHRVAALGHAGAQVQGDREEVGSCLGQCDDDLGRQHIDHVVQRGDRGAHVHFQGGPGIDGHDRAEGAFIVAEPVGQIAMKLEPDLEIARLDEIARKGDDPFEFARARRQDTLKHALTVDRDAQGGDAVGRDVLHAADHQADIVHRGIAQQRHLDGSVGGIASQGQAVGPPGVAQGHPRGCADIGVGGHREDATGHIRQITPETAVSGVEHTGVEQGDDARQGDHRKNN